MIKVYDKSIYRHDDVDNYVIVQQVDNVIIVTGIVVIFEITR